MSYLLVGLDEIARYMGLSLDTLKRQSRELQKARVLFPMWRGCPPKLRICAFTDRLQAWLYSFEDER